MTETTLSTVAVGSIKRFSFQLTINGRAKLQCCVRHSLVCRLQTVAKRCVLPKNCLKK